MSQFDLESRFFNLILRIEQINFVVGQWVIHLTSIAGWDSGCRLAIGDCMVDVDRGASHWSSMYSV